MRTFLTEWDGPELYGRGGLGGPLHQQARVGLDAGHFAVAVPHSAVDVVALKIRGC